MAKLDPATRERALSCLGSGRLSAPALQNGIDMTGLIRTALPCGGLTRHQINAVNFAPLTRLVANISRWFGQMATPPHPPH